MRSLLLLGLLGAAFGMARRLAARPDDVWQRATAADAPAGHEGP